VKPIFIAIPAAIVLVLILYLMGLLDILSPKPPSEKYKDRNPIVVVHDSEMEALAAAIAESKAIGGQHYKTSGTPSMEPLISGQVYIVSAPKPYDQLQEGEIANYGPKWANGGLVLHRLVSKDKEGWIASGDNNRNSESWEKVKPDNYRDCVVKIHTYKGAEKTRVKK
jgi:hypothetical protein